MDQVEARALALVGTEFRPQGRSAEGVDCAGLVLLACRLPIDDSRRDYRLRGDHWDELQPIIARHFRTVAVRLARAPQPGDLLVMAERADQVHLAIASTAGLIHADARIGRVVERPGAPPWPVIGVYRLRKGI